LAGKKNKLQNRRMWCGMKDKIYRVVIILEMLAILCIISKENDIKEEIEIDMGKKLRTVPIYAETVVETGIEAAIEMDDILDEEREERLEAEYGGRADLSMWAGKYSFFETCLASNQVVYMVMGYDIEIYQDGQGKYCADIIIHGHLTSIAVRAKVFGDEDEISFIFEEYLPDHYDLWTYSEDSPLLSFRREKDTGLIYTYWGQISAILLTYNEESGKIYFEKVEED